MNTYTIHESHVDNVNKMAKRIRNKGVCVYVEQVGEEYRDGLRFVKLRVYGSYKINGWNLIAKIEHTECGNIVNVMQDSFSIPPEYYSISAKCDHCHTNRNRGVTFIIKNDNGEYRQVGKSCLKQYTNGLDAEAVASYFDFIDNMHDIVKSDCDEQFSDAERYIDKMTYLECVLKVVDMDDGFISRASARDNGCISTADRALQLYCHIKNCDINGYGRCRWCSYITTRDIEMFRDEAADALAEIDMTERVNEFTNNLKVILCNYNRMIDVRNIGTAAAFWYFTKSAKNRSEKKKAKSTGHVGELGGFIKVNVVDAYCLGSWSGYNGNLTHRLRFVTDKGEFVDWRTSVMEEDDAKQVKVLTGFVKEHAEEGVTIITRGKRIG